MILGGFNEFANMENSKEYDLQGIDHEQIRVTFDFIRIDSWDDEKAYANVAGEEIFQEQLDWQDGGARICGTETNPEWVDSLIPVDSGSIGHTAPTLTVTIGAEVDSPPDNESWGIDNVEVFAR